jgi:hypothetical protein
MSNGWWNTFTSKPSNKCKISIVLVMVYTGLNSVEEIPGILAELAGRGLGMGSASRWVSSATMLKYCMLSISRPSRLHRRWESSGYGKIGLRGLQAEY